MARVTGPDGTDLGDVTSRGALAYYRREPGYTVHDDEAPTVETVTVDEPVITAPARSASKQEWVDYANQVDPGNVETISEMTKDELVEHYGE